MPLQRVQGRGQVTITRELRERGQIKPGDLVHVRVVEPGRLELTRVDAMPLEELWRQFRIPGPVDFERDRRDWETEAARQALSEGA